MHRFRCQLRLISSVRAPANLAKDAVVSQQQGYQVLPFFQHASNRMSELRDKEVGQLENSTDRALKLFAQEMHWLCGSQALAWLPVVTADLLGSSFRADISADDSTERAHVRRVITELRADLRECTVDGTRLLLPASVAELVEKNTADALGLGVPLRALAHWSERTCRSLSEHVSVDTWQVSAVSLVCNTLALSALAPLTELTAIHLHEKSAANATISMHPRGGVTIRTIEAIKKDNEIYTDPLGLNDGGFALNRVAKVGDFCDAPLLQDPCFLAVQLGHLPADLDTAGVDAKLNDAVLRRWPLFWPLAFVPTSVPSVALPMSPIFPGSELRKIALRLVDTGEQEEQAIDTVDTNVNVPSDLNFPKLQALLENSTAMFGHLESEQTPPYARKLAQTGHDQSQLTRRLLSELAHIERAADRAVLLSPESPLAHRLRNVVKNAVVWLRRDVAEEVLLAPSDAAVCAVDDAERPVRSGAVDLFCRTLTPIRADDDFRADGDFRADAAAVIDDATTDTVLGRVFTREVPAGTRVRVAVAAAADRWRSELRESSGTLHNLCVQMPAMWTHELSRLEQSLGLMPYAVRERGQAKQFVRNSGLSEQEGSFECLRSSFERSLLPDVRARFSRDVHASNSVLHEEEDGSVSVCTIKDVAAGEPVVLCDTPEMRKLVESVELHTCEHFVGQAALYDVEEVLHAEDRRHNMRVSERQRQAVFDALVSACTGVPVGHRRMLSLPLSPAPEYIIAAVASVVVATADVETMEKLMEYAKTEGSETSMPDAAAMQAARHANSLLEQVRMQQMPEVMEQQEQLLQLAAPLFSDACKLLSERLQTVSQHLDALTGESDDENLCTSVELQVAAETRLLCETRARTLRQWRLRLLALSDVDFRVLGLMTPPL